MSSHPSPETNPSDAYTDAPEAIAAYALDGEPTPATTDSAPEPARVGGLFIGLYMFAYFGLNLVMLMPALFSLAYKVQLIDPAGKDAGLGLVLGLGAIVGLVTGPVAGVFSDATRLRFGRRRPWLVAGLVVAAAGAALVASASSIPSMVVGWGVCQLAVSMISAGFNPILAEQVPSIQRAKLGAFGGVAASIAGVGASLFGSFLTGNLLLLFLLPPLVFAVGLALFLGLMKDKPAASDVVVPAAGEILRSFWFNPIKHSDFALVWLGKFFLQFGFTFFSTYQLYFLLSRLGYTPEEAGQRLATVGGLSLLATMSFAVIGGILSDRLRRRKMFIYTGAGLIVVGLIVVATASTLAPYVIGGVVLSAGVGLFTSVDLATATDLLPEKDKAGKYMGIYYLSSGLTGVIAPLIAPLIIAVGGGGNYSLLFIVGAILAAGAGITAWRLRGVQ